MKKLFIAVANGIFVPKNTNFSPEDTELQNSAEEFDGKNLVYDFATPHCNNRQCVVTELEAYGYTRKGGVGTKISILYSLTPSVNASTHPYLQVLWQFQSVKLICDVVILHLCLSSLHPQMIVAKPP